MAIPLLGRVRATLNKLTRSQKALAVVAAVLIAMFVTSTATNGRNSATPDDPRQHDLVQWLGGRFGGSAEVAADDLTAGCPAPAAALSPAAPSPATSVPAVPSPVVSATPGPAEADGRRRIAIDASCVLTVAGSEDDVRTVTLTSADYPARVRARAPHGSEQVDAELAAGDSIEIAVDGDGVEITVSCQGADSCVLAIGKEA
jgi:hypothetical protein